MKPDQRRCLEKGRWKTGERRRIKGRHEHLVWEKEQKGGAEDEKAEDTEGGVAAATEDTEAGNFLDPYQDPPNPEPEDILTSTPKRAALRERKLHRSNRWISEAATQAGRGRDDGSGGGVATGSGSAPTGGRFIRRKRRQ